MHLTSSLEVSGSKSSQHYLVIHHNDRHELIVLPKSYSDLETQIQELFHIDKGRFHLETDELNLCKGKRIKIPKVAWEDIAELLGNVQIMVWPADSGVANPGPESAPAAESATPSSANVVQGELTLDGPLIDGRVLAVQLANINVEATPLADLSSDLHIRMLDENKECVLTVSILPKLSRILLTTSSSEYSFNRTIKEAFHSKQQDHSIIVRKEGRQIHLLCDFQPVGTVESPRDFFISSVTYDLGLQSPIEGPISATVHATLPAFYLSALQNNTDNFYRRVVECEPDDAPFICGTMSAIRGEGSTNGIKRRSQRIHRTTWVDSQWNMRQGCIFVARFTYPLGVSPETITIFFGTHGHPVRSSLQLLIRATDVQVDEFNEKGIKVTHGVLELPTPPQSPGEHTIAFINEQDTIHVIFDFCKAVSFPNGVTKTWNPGHIYIHAPADRILDLDLYEFGK